MKFPLIQLYSMNRSKPIVGIDITEVQWDYCDLEGLPPEREGISMVSHGTIPRGQRENLPETLPHAFDLFLNSLIVNNTKNLVTPTEAALRSGIMELIYQSEKEKKWINI